MLATCPNDPCAAAKGRRFAKKACELAAAQKCKLSDTLAAALLRMENFRSNKVAEEGVGDSAYKQKGEEARARLRLYEQNKRFGKRDNL